MEMAVTLVDYSVDTSAWVDVSCFQGLHAGRCSWGKTNRYNVGYTSCSTAWCRVASLSAKKKKKKGQLSKGVGKSHHAPPSKLTRQKGKVKAYNMNIYRHIQSELLLNMSSARTLKKKDKSKSKRRHVHSGHVWPHSHSGLRQQWL